MLYVQSYRNRLLDYILETARFTPNGEFILIDEYPSNSGIGIFFSFFGNTLSGVQDTTKYDYIIITPDVDAETNTFDGAQFYSVGHIFDIMDTSLFGLDNISLTYKYDEALYQQDMGIVSYLVTGTTISPTNIDATFKKEINFVQFIFKSIFIDNFRETFAKIFVNFHQCSYNFIGIFFVQII